MTTITVDVRDLIDEGNEFYPKGEFTALAAELGIKAGTTWPKTIKIQFNDGVEVMTMTELNEQFATYLDSEQTKRLVVFND